MKGDLRSTFGNPTPLALLGFLLSLSPLSCQMMGWRGAGGGADAGIAGVGSYYFIVCVPSLPLELFLSGIDEEKSRLIYVSREACS